MTLVHLGGGPGMLCYHVVVRYGLLGRRLQDRSATMVASVAISGLLMR
jgi:hypothetical protein